MGDFLSLAVIVAVRIKLPLRKDDIREVTKRKFSRLSGGSTSVGTLARVVTIALAAVSTFLFTTQATFSFHVGATSLVVAIWLAMASRSRHGTALGMVSAAGPFFVTAIWFTGRGVTYALDIKDASAHPSLLATSLAGVGIFLILAAQLPRHYSNGQVAVDIFSIRTALDGSVAAVSLSALYWMFTQETQASLFIFVAVSAALAGPQLASVTHGKTADRIRGYLGIILFVGAMVTSAANGDGMMTVGHMLFAIGLAGQMWSLPEAEPQKPSAQRVFETENVFPMVFLFSGWVAGFAFFSELVSTWQMRAFGLLSLSLVIIRVVISKYSEKAIVGQVNTLVYTDPLTGIGNRRALLERLTNGPGWVMTLDLDSFKAINDQFGHEAGDMVLVRFVDRIRAILPMEGAFFRIGGDEFAVVVPQNTRNIKTLTRELVSCGPDPFHSQVSVSIGLAPFSATDSPAGALRGSDIALQEAKQAGKNRAAVLDDDMLADRMRELNISTRLRDGGLDDIYVVYQPLVAMGWPGKPTVGVEALARWNDRELGVIPPGEFVPIAERQGMIPELGLTVLRQALEQLRMWMNEGCPIQISINVSVLQLRDEKVVAQMERLLAVEPELAKWIILEVTETVFTDDDRAVGALRQLRSLGLCTALDDFGTGASTLTRLRHLPIDVMKIDRSLVMGAGTDASADAILDMVATLGRRMQMVLVAEGLEDDVATDRCQQLGYAVGQGYIFSQPVAANMLPPFAKLERPALPRRPLVDKLWMQNAFTATAQKQQKPAQQPRQQQAAPAAPAQPATPPAAQMPGQGAGYAPRQAATSAAQQPAPGQPSAAQQVPAQHYQQGHRPSATPQTAPPQQAGYVQQAQQGPPANTGAAPQAPAIPDRRDPRGEGRAPHVGGSATIPVQHRTPVHDRRARHAQAEAYVNRQS